MNSRRFDKSATDLRPYGTHRYDMFGPKVGRRLTLFGLHSFHLWLQLETDPNIITYCERPVILDDAGGARVIDFWVSTKKEEALHLVLQPSELARVARGERLYPAFEEWARANSMVLTIISPDEIRAGEILCRNRLKMLNYQAMNFERPNLELSDEIVIACTLGCTLRSLEQRFAAFEPTLVHAVAFSLVLFGRLNCPTLDVQPLDRDSRLVAQ